MNLKKTKKMLIISLEGVESNTEKNFYTGLFYHFLDKIKPKVIAFGKLSKKQAMQEKFKKRMEIFLRRSIDFTKNSSIFFIGDGYPAKDIKSMERARKFIISYLKDAKVPVEYYSKLIYDKGKSFEDIFNSNKNIKVSGIISNKKQKKESNRRLFNDIIDSIVIKSLENREGELKSFLYEIFKNSCFKEIIDFIYN